LQEIADLPFQVKYLNVYHSPTSRTQSDPLSNWWRKMAQKKYPLGYRGTIERIKKRRNRSLRSSANSGPESLIYGSA